MGGPGPHTTVRTRPPRRRVAHHVSASAAVARRTAVLHQRSYRADAGMAVADRWGWLPEAAVRRQAARTTTATGGSRGGHTRSRSLWAASFSVGSVRYGTTTGVTSIRPHLGGCSSSRSSPSGGSRPPASKSSWLKESSSSTTGAASLEYSTNLRLEASV